MKINVSSFDANKLLQEETIFHNANGYLGVRGAFEEGYAKEVKTVRGCYINAFYDTINIKYPEKLFGFPETAQRQVNIPDSQTSKIFINGDLFSLFSGEILDYKRSLNMESGTTTRCIRWKSPKDNIANITIKRMVSFVRPELFLTEIIIQTENCRHLDFESEINCDVHNFFDSNDPRVASDQERHIQMIGAEFTDGIGVCLSKTAKSGLYVATAMSHTVNTPHSVQRTKMSTGCKTEISVTLKNDVVVINKFCAYSDSRRHDNCKERALSVLKEAVSVGADALFKEQEDYLKNFWNNCGITIEGDEKISESMAFNLYGLLQSAGTDHISNITSKGLSGEGYEGHYFWDTEIYMLPFFLFTMPNRAKTLLEYRHYILDKAKEQAKILGHKKGALYTWRTITGSECSAYYPSGSAQYHINGDIAHAFIQYYYATKDINFMEEKGAEVLVETARFWADAGTYDELGRLCYNCVTGPDEYTCIVNNNYFTNVSAKHNLLAAVFICDELKKADKYNNFANRTGISDAELEFFEKAANDIYIPYNATFDINPQDDSFLKKAKWDLASIPKNKFPLLKHYHPLKLYRSQICKQADVVLAHFLYNDAPPSTIKNSYNYYEAITTHDSSLSKCIFGIMASFLNMEQKAYDYFLSVVRTDLDDAHNNTKDGIHTANMGGAYLAVTAGFAGMRLENNKLLFRFSIPKTWRGYSFKVNYLGSRFKVFVEEGKATFTLDEGLPVTVFIDEKELIVDSVHTILWES